MVMTHHPAKANLEKGSSWPPEAIPYGVVLSVDLSNPNLPNPHLGPDPRPPTLLKSAYNSIISYFLALAKYLPVRFTGQKPCHRDGLYISKSVGPLTQWLLLKTKKFTMASA